MRRGGGGVGLGLGGGTCGRCTGNRKGPDTGPDLESHVLMRFQCVFFCSNVLLL